MFVDAVEFVDVALGVLECRVGPVAGGEERPRSSRDVGKRRARQPGLADAMSRPSRDSWENSQDDDGPGT